MLKDEELLLEKIGKGEITNWCALEIEASLLGFEKISRDLFSSILEFSGYYENFYNLLNKTIIEDDIIDYRFENELNINTLLTIHGKYVFKNIYLNGSTSFKPYGQDSIKVNSLEWLKKIDSRHPRYLLKFFLHKGNSLKDRKIKDIYLKLFLMVIERTKVRMEKSKKFEVFFERLESKFKEYMTYEMMAN